MSTSVTRRRGSTLHLLHPLASVLCLFLFASQVTWTAGKTGYDYSSGGRGGGGGLGARGGIPGYQAQNQRGGNLALPGRFIPDERSVRPPQCPPGVQSPGCLPPQPPSRLFMQPRKFPKTGNCAYLSKCTTCQDQCPPPPGGCNKPSQLPTLPGDNPTDCCPQWKCGVNKNDKHGIGWEIGITNDGKVCILGTPGCNRAGINDKGQLCILGTPGCGEIGIDDNLRPCVYGTPGCHKAGVDERTGQPCILGTPGCGPRPGTGIGIDKTTGEPCVLGTPGCGEPGVTIDGRPCIPGTPGCGEAGIDGNGKPCQIGTPGCGKIGIDDNGNQCRLGDPGCHQWPGPKKPGKPTTVSVGGNSLGGYGG